MSSAFKRLMPFIKNGLILLKRNPFRESWYLPRRLRHEDQFFMVEEERELSNPEYHDIANEYLGVVAKGHRTFVIQPYIKWGKDKRFNTDRELQLAESVALVETLPYWSVVDKMWIPLLNLQRNKLFGTGGLETIKTRIKCGRNVTAIFVSTNKLKHVQLLELEKIFGLPIYDRYSLVIHIFRSHAKSPEAKLQVALAELPYIYKKMSELGGRINLLESRRMYLQAREGQLRTALKKLKVHRASIRNKRKNYGFATVAVVGYTNAGKTSLIKGEFFQIIKSSKNYKFFMPQKSHHCSFNWRFWIRTKKLSICHS